MNSQNITTPIKTLCLLLLLVGPLRAQVSLPVPDKTVDALITVLESDGPTFDKAKACQQLAITGNARAVPALASLLADDRLATYARSALEVIPGPQADAALRKAAGSLKGDNLLGVLHSIGKRGDTQAVPLLGKLLVAKSPATQLTAARALARIGTPRAAELLQQAFSKASATSRINLAQACLICAQSLTTKGDIKRAVAICRMLSSAELPQHIHWSATYSAILAQGRDGVPLLLKMLDSGNPAQFRLAIQAAPRLGNDVNVATELASRLETQSAENQALLLIALGDLGDKRVLPSVLRIAGSSAGEVRVRAIAVLAKLGDQSCAPVLLKAATAADQAVADAACAALTGLEGDQINASIVKMLGSEDTRTLLSAIQIASKRNIHAAAAALLKLAHREDATTRQNAIRALGRAATVDQLPELIDLAIATIGTDDSGIVQQALRSACIRMPQEECTRELADAIADAPEPAKIILLEQLAVVGGTKALQTIVAAAKSHDATMQDAATRLLGEWLTSDSAPALLELAKTLPKGKYRMRALRGYIRIARQLYMTTDQRMEVCRNALAVADRNAEKLLVLEVLRRYPTPEGRQLAESLLENKELAGPVRTTVASIDKAIGTKGSDPPGFVALFDGKTLDGWKGNLDFWRVEDGAIVGGSLTKMVEHNEFLRTQKRFTDFELRLQFKLTGSQTNGGVQFRSQEIPNDFEVSGYQADLGNGWWGCLYDESRRRKVLAGPPTDQRVKPVRMGTWNEYQIRCEGKRIRLWINGIQTVDYTEQDANIQQTGIIAVQVHGQLKMEARYRNIRIKEL